MDSHSNSLDARLRKKLTDTFFHMGELCLFSVELKHDANLFNEFTELFVVIQLPESRHAIPFFLR